MPNKPKNQPNIPSGAERLRRRAEAELQVLRKSRSRPMMAELCHRAEAQLRNGKKTPAALPTDADSQRLVHELQVHQVELELQNTELLKARNEVEMALEKYTDLYDFAPTGYFTLDEQGQIHEANLTGAVLLGAERSRLVNRHLKHFVAHENHAAFLVFLGQVLGGAQKQVLEVLVRKEDGTTFWANFHGAPAFDFSGSGKLCRVAVSDITSLKMAEDAQRRAVALAVANQELRLEIVHRHAAEKALKKSQKHQSRLLSQSRHMQEQMRRMSHQILLAQEEERKRISRELHDEITQTLVGINVHLETLSRDARINPAGLRRKIARTQRLVEKSVVIVHQFARDLRPTALDDLGLIATLHAFLKDFTKRTGIHVHLTAFAALDQLNSIRRTVIYRVVQSALNNVAQHARASRVTVTLRKLAFAVHLKIADNGRSFDVNRVLHAKTNKRLGLIGMRERVEMVGGKFLVESAPGHGTTVQAHIPTGKAPKGPAKDPATP